MNPDLEIRRLLDVMPASGRMRMTVKDKPEQPHVISRQRSLPWAQNQPITINFGHWQRLSQPQRDLAILRVVSWLMTSNPFKPDLYQGLTLAGALGAVVEGVQGDIVGLLVAGGLSAIAATQVWRTSRSLPIELAADEAAIRVAQRRGYSETEAAQHLFSAIHAIAKLEGRSHLEFNELIRCQNLRALAGLSRTGVPETYK